MCDHQQDPGDVPEEKDVEIIEDDGEE